MSSFGSRTVAIDNRLVGVQAVARDKGYGFAMGDECNHCTVKRIRDRFGPLMIFEADNGGVEVLVHGVPLVWFDAIPPRRCTCKT